MSISLLHALDFFFFLFHTVLILFNLFGWMVPRWRKINLLTLSLTAFSWFVLGIRFGWGYCLCTDWHWQIRKSLGYHDMSDSYIHFLILQLTGLHLPPYLVDTATVICFFTACFISILLSVKKRSKPLSGEHNRFLK